MRKVALFVASDKHSGHRQGLANPKTKLKEDVPMKGEDVYSQVALNALQVALWDLTKSVRRWSGSNLRGYEKWFIDLGEVVQGNEYSDDLMTDRMNEQRILARESIEPFLELKGVKGARIHHATTWHDYANGSMPELIADELQMSYPKLDIKANHKSMIEIDDFLLQFFHTGPNPGKRKRLEPNGAYWAAHDLMLENMIEHEPIPDLVVTAHHHKPSKATPSFVQKGEFTSCTWMTTPPLCGPGAFSRKVANPDYFYVGMSVVLIVDGKLLDIVPFFAKMYDYTKEQL